MPQLVLELSANVLEKQNLTHLFEKCHQILTQFLPTDIDNCKSRAIENTIYYVGNGSAHNAFIHLSIKVLSGRTSEVLKNVGEKILEIVKSYFSESLKKLNLQITLEIAELSKNYFKITSEKEL